MHQLYRIFPRFYFFSSLRVFIRSNCSLPPFPRLFARMPILMTPISLKARTTVLLSVYLSLFSVAGVAASFDCKKASTLVERQICADPTLSALDDQLAAAYQRALAAAKDKQAILDQQRAWLSATRDDCSNEACLKAAYKSRLVQLDPAKKKGEAEKAIQTLKRYPPYPDVWHRKIPEPREIFPSSLSYGRDADGDITVFYARSPVTRPEDFDRSKGAIRFFSGEHAAGISFAQYRKDSKPAYPQAEIALEGGKTIKRESLDERIPLRCPQQLNSFFVITDTNGQSVRKSLLYILDRPQQHPIEDRCADTSERRFNAKVVAIQGDFLPIDDGTFLVKDGEGGVVIRFDANLNTKTPLLGKQLFWVDTMEIQRFRKDGDVNYQAMHDEILTLLRAKKGD